MRKLSTGEPYAGKPHVRFGGRGGASLSDPYRRMFAHPVQCASLIGTRRIVGADLAAIQSHPTQPTPRKPAWINDLQPVWLKNGVNRASPGMPSVQQVFARLSEGAPAVLTERSIFFPKQGGTIDGNTRRELEERTGKPIVPTKISKQLN